MRIRRSLPLCTFCTHSGSAINPRPMAIRSASPVARISSAIFLANECCRRSPSAYGICRVPRGRGSASSRLPATSGRFAGSGLSFCAAETLMMSTLSRHSSRMRSESSSVLPPFKKSSALMRRLIGKRGPTQARTLSIIRLNMRVRFSILPPNSSVRLLNNGDKKTG